MLLNEFVGLLNKKNTSRAKRLKLMRTFKKNQDKGKIIEYFKKSPNAKKFLPPYVDNIDDLYDMTDDEVDELLDNVIGNMKQKHPVNKMSMAGDPEAHGGGGFT